MEGEKKVNLTSRRGLIEHLTNTNK